MDKVFLIFLILIWCSGNVRGQSEIPKQKLSEIIGPLDTPVIPVKPVNPYNGLNPIEGQFPWVVLIERLRRDDYTQKEAAFIGAIISVNYVVTQARYLNRSTNKTYRLSFGATLNTNTSYVVQYSNIVKIHGSYNPNNTYYYNIALIKTPMPLSFSSTISSIALNKNMSDFFWREVYFVAIMPTGINGTNYSKKYNKLRILGSNVICEALLTPPRKLGNETCTLSTISNPLQNPCTLDQGLIAVFQNFGWILLGIGNSMTGCSLYVPRTFTRVDMFEECISNLAGINGFETH